MVLASLKKVQDICLYEWGSVCGVLGKLFPFCFVNIFIFLAGSTKDKLQRKI